MVRRSVKENVLPGPALITEEDCEEFITVFGQGWVCEVEGIIAGFSIADVKKYLGFIRSFRS